MATPSSQTDAPVLNETRARQGRFGKHVVWVLLISTVLAAAALFAAWGWKSDDMAAVEPNNGRQAADAQPFDVQSAPRQNTVSQVPAKPGASTTSGSQP